MEKCSRHKFWPEEGLDGVLRGKRGWAGVRAQEWTSAHPAGKRGRRGRRCGAQAWGSLRQRAGSVKRQGLF